MLGLPLLLIFMYSIVFFDYYFYYILLSLVYVFLTICFLLHFK